MKMEMAEKKKELAVIRDEMMAEYKKDLPKLLDTKIDDLVEMMASYGKGKMTAIEINSLIRANNYCGNAPKYSADEMNIVYEAYIRMIAEINKQLASNKKDENKVYLPTKQNFCGFAGITTSTYANYLTSNDEQMRETMQRIEDYITDTNLSMAQANQVNAIPTMFRAKTEHGYVEATAPIQIEHKREVDVGSVLRKIEQIKKNKTLKTVEISADDYTVEQ